MKRGRIEISAFRRRITVYSSSPARDSFTQEESSPETVALMDGESWPAVFAGTAELAHQIQMVMERHGETSVNTCHPGTGQFNSRSVFKRMKG